MKIATGHYLSATHTERRGVVAEMEAGKGRCGSVFSQQSVEQRFGLFQVGRVKPFGEPAVELG